MNRWSEYRYEPADITKITREEFVRFIEIAGLKITREEMIRLFGRSEIEDLNNRYPEYRFYLHLDDPELVVMSRDGYSVDLSPFIVKAMLS